MTDENASVHLYGLIHADRCFSPESEGVGGGIAFAIQGAVAAIVGHPSPDEYIGARRELIAHAAVLEEALLKARAVLPAQFGQVAPSIDALLAQVLAEKASAHLASLNAIDGQAEFTVKAFWSGDGAFQKIADSVPEIGARKVGLIGRPEAETYYERIELGRLVAEAVQTRAARLSEDLAQALRSVTKSLDMLPPATAKQAFGQTLRIDRDHEKNIEEIVGSFADRNEEDLRVKLLGPAPLYQYLSTHTTGLT